MLWYFLVVTRFHTVIEVITNCEIVASEFKKGKNMIH